MSCLTYLVPVRVQRVPPIQVLLVRGRGSGEGPPQAIQRAHKELHKERHRRQELDNCCGDDGPQGPPQGGRQVSREQQQQQQQRPQLHEQAVPKGADDDSRGLPEIRLRDGRPHEADRGEPRRDREHIQGGVQACAECGVPEGDVQAGRKRRLHGGRARRPREAEAAARGRRLRRDLCPPFLQQLRGVHPQVPARGCRGDRPPAQRVLPPGADPLRGRGAGRQAREAARADHRVRRDPRQVHGAPRADNPRRRLLCCLRGAPGGPLQGDLLHRPHRQPSARRRQGRLAGPRHRRDRGPRRGP